MTYRDQYLTSKSWIRKAAIMDLFHCLQRNTHASWDIKKTAEYFGVSIGLVSENIKLARNLEKVKDCTSRNKALTLMKNGARQ